MTNKLSEKSGGGLIYNPPMMQFDGSTGYYDKTTGIGSGNKVSIVVRFQLNSFTGDAYRRIVRIENAGGGTIIGLGVFSSDYSADTRDDCLEFYVANSGDTGICQLLTDTSWVDGEPHTAVINFDGDAGTGSFVIDGVDAVDTGHASYIAPTTGTLAARVGIGFGANEGGGSYFAGNLGFFGYDDSAGLVWSDFMNSSGDIIKQDEDTWANSGWGAQPLFWHSAGKMDENKGSAGVMTKNGTITLTDVDYAPMLGLPTIGTAESHHIKTGKVAWVDGVERVGTGYFPAMMQFNGSTGYFSDTSYTSSGNKVTVVCRFSRVSFTGGGTEFILAAAGPSASTDYRAALFVRASDHVTTEEQSKLQFLVRNSSGVDVCKLISLTGLCDGNVHTVFVDYDGDTGTANFIVDGASADDGAATNRVAPTTATVDSGAGSDFCVASSGTVGANFFGGKVGYVGMRDIDGLTWSDFLQTDGTPKPLDESTWTEWGAQPLFWNPHGDMVNNLGSAGAMTKNGTINVAFAQ